MSSAWQIDLVDCVKSLVKVSNLPSNQTSHFLCKGESAIHSKPEILLRLPGMLLGG